MVEPIDTVSKEVKHEFIQCVTLKLTSNALVTLKKSQTRLF